MINTMNEKPLHAALKAWYAQPGDAVELQLEGYHIDLVRGDLLIEIQTRNFGALRRKLTRLVEHHPIRLVYPIPAKKWIVRLNEDKTSEMGRRKSPKNGRWEHLFEELVSIPHLLLHPNFELDVLLIHEEEARHFQAGRSWRRKGWGTTERRLLAVCETRHFSTPQALLALLPDGLPAPFCTGILAQQGKMPRRLAQQIVYCLHACHVVSRVGKKGNAWQYIITEDTKGSF